jgi:transposase InsO family protein
MIGLEDRRMIAQNVQEAHEAGARLRLACETAGIDVRTLQRWKACEGLEKGDRRPVAVRPAQAHALTARERETVLAVANESRFADMPPSRIVPALADEGTYLASESTFSRLLRAQGQNAHRGRSKAPRQSRPPSTHIATAPRQVWCWDMTYLPARVVGMWFYLYLILDLYSRKIVAWEVHDTDDANHAARLVQRAALGEGIAAEGERPVRGQWRHAQGHDRAGDAGVARREALVLAAARERRQCLRRIAVPHRKVPARVPRRRLRQSRIGAPMGLAVRALVQP